MDGSGAGLRPEAQDWGPGRSPRNDQAMETDPYVSSGPTCPVGNAASAYSLPKRIHPERIIAPA